MNVVVDAMGLVWRAHHASRGDGYAYAASMIRRLIDDMVPESMSLALDSGYDERRAIWPGYKATRGARPREVLDTLTSVRVECQRIGVKSFAADGWEADDVIAALVREGDWCVVSADKDLLQLVTDRVFVLRPEPRGLGLVTMNKDGVYDLLGVAPHLVTDLLALAGDASDCVPGVRGVGEHTAVGLLHRHGDLNGVYAELEMEHVTLRKKLEAGREMAFLSKRLVTLNHNVPVKEVV